MGTRNLTCVVVNNEYKIAQYGQWDGYPTGQGKTIVDFIKKKYNKEKFLKALEKVSFVTLEEVQEAYVKAGVPKGEQYVSSEQVKKFEEILPAINRDLGALILEMVQEGAVNKLQNESEFGKDSLFCEYAYVLDLDRDILEVYKGFNTKQVSESERFYDEPKENKGIDTTYYAVKLYAEYKFSELTDTTMDELNEKMEAEPEND